jgi:hypothetical protein
MTISRSTAEPLTRVLSRERVVPAGVRFGAVFEQIMVGPERYFVNQLSFDRMRVVAWSLWEGNLKMPSGAALRGLLVDYQISLTCARMSGQAPVFHLRRHVGPKRVVPIPSDVGDRSCGLFPRVERHADGDWWLAGPK